MQIAANAAKGILVMYSDYHKPLKLSDIIIGVSRSGNIWVKRYTRIQSAGKEVYSDFPLYDFTIETLGM